MDTSIQDPQPDREQIFTTFGHAAGAAPTPTAGSKTGRKKTENKAIAKTRAMISATDAHGFVGVPAAQGLQRNCLNFVFIPKNRFSK